MKRLLLFLLLSSCAFGQGVFAPPQTALKVVNGITSPLPNATITVCLGNASGIPCAPVLTGTLFKDLALTQALSNPFTSDANGNYQFAARQGTYTVTVTGLGFSGYSYQVTLGGGVSLPPAPLVGDIPRYNVNGDSNWDAVQYPQLYDGVFACSINVSCASGMYVGTAPTGCCSEAVVGLQPTLGNPFNTTEYQNNVTSTNGIVGLLHLQNGNNGLFHVRGFWRMSFKAAISAISNSRFYWGLGVWANASTLGTNGTQPIGTTAFSTDTPNHTFLGWRWSSTTDTNFKCLAIQAGASPTTVIVDSGIVADSNLHSFDITLDSGNTTFTCYLDGKQVGTIPATTLTFTPTNSSDALGSLFFTGDDKNIATGGIQFTLASMFIGMRQ